MHCAVLLIHIIRYCRENLWLVSWSVYFSVLYMRGVASTKLNIGIYHNPFQMNSLCCILNVQSGYYGHYGSFGSRRVGTSYYGGEIYFYVQSTFMYPRQGYL